MNPKEYFLALKEYFKKLFPDKTKEIDELKEPDIKTPTPAPVPAEKGLSDEMKNFIATLQAENKKVLDELAVLKQKEVDRDKLLTDKATADQKQKVQDAIKKAIEDKKIPAKDDATIATYTKLFELDFDNTSKVITALPVIAGEKKPGEQIPAKGIEVKGPFGSVDRTILKAVNDMAATSQN